MRLTVPVEWRPSPHHNPRPAWVAIDTIVLHADASSEAGGTLSWLQDPRSKVSYHFLVSRNGRVYECVSVDRRAWHAGKSSFEERPDCNDYSIGVCFSNRQDGKEAFTDAQYQMGADLIADIMSNHPAIVPSRITTHAHVATPAGRKVDPGPLFDMERFLAQVEVAVNGYPKVPA